VLVDKPIGITREQVDTLIAAARKSTKTFAWIARVGSQPIQRACDAVAAGELGTIVNVHAHFLATYGPGDVWDEEQRAFFDPAVNGGGELLNFGLYPLSAILLITGLAPVEVHCVAGAYYNRAHHELDLEDMALLNMRLTGGIVGTVCVGRAHVPGNAARGDFWVQVIGTKRTLIAEELAPDAIYMGPEDRVVEPRYRVPNVNMFHFDALVDNFVWAVRTGGKPFLGADEAEKVMHAVFAAYESARTGRPVAVQ
jgi:predicted dehydrogenase